MGRGGEEKIHLPVCIPGQARRTSDGRRLRIGASRLTVETPHTTGNSLALALFLAEIINLHTWQWGYIAPWTDDDHDVSS